MAESYLKNVGMGAFGAGLKFGLSVQTVTHADLTAAATSEEIAITGDDAMPAGAFKVAAWIDLDTVFSGGSVSACTASVGDTGDPDELMAAIDVFTGASTGRRGGEGADVGFTWEDSYSPVIRFAATSDNVVNLDAGSLRVFLLWAQPSIG